MATTRNGIRKVKDTKEETLEGFEGEIEDLEARNLEGQLSDIAHLILNLSAPGREVPRPMPDYDTRSSRVTHGAVHVLAYLHETDASCSEVAREAILAESSVYRWLTELEEIGILEADAARVDGRAVMEYPLEDNELGAAAQVVVDRL